MSREFIRIDDLIVHLNRRKKNENLFSILHNVGDMKLNYVVK